MPATSQGRGLPAFGCEAQRITHYLVRTHSPAAERQFSQSPASAISRRSTSATAASRSRSSSIRKQQAVEFGVEIGEYRGVVRVPRRVFQRLLPETPTPRGASKPITSKRTRFESIAERKLRRRQLTEDGNVEISGRDLR